MLEKSEGGATLDKHNTLDLFITQSCGMQKQIESNTL